MCRNNGMSIAPYGVLGQGKFKTPEELQKRATLRGGKQPTEKDLEICKIMQEIADELGGGVHLAHSKSTFVPRLPGAKLTFSRSGLGTTDDD